MHPHLLGGLQVAQALGPSININGVQNVLGKGRQVTHYLDIHHFS